MKEASKKPGSSNAGKYKTKGPYCGPAGGAAKGSYPVNTRKRAISALAYARHAPNPGGIKKCVCRNWPSLPACKKKKKDGVEEWTLDSIYGLDEIRSIYADNMLSLEGVVCELVDFYRIENLSDSELAEVLKYVLIDEDIDTAIDTAKQFIETKGE